MSLIYLLVVGCAAGMTWLLTGLILKFAPLDRPTARSSHTVPTPRGGGLAIVITTLGGAIWAMAAGLLESTLGWGIIGAGGLTALIGLWDDLAGLRPAFRLGVQVLAGAWALVWIGGYPQVAFGEVILPLGWMGMVLACAGIVWATNLFNFMDGIDGLAAIEALCIGAGGFLLLARYGMVEGLPIPALIVGAAFGFLGWNRPPARIFMGDVGSGFLGALAGVLAVWAERSGGPPVILWAVLGMTFIFDATVTLIRRGWRRERLTEAHRSHAYQRLVAAGWSHGRVTFAALTLNLGLIGLTFLSPMPALFLAVILVGVAYVAVERLQPM